MRLKRLIACLLMTASLFACLPAVYVASVHIDFDESTTKMSGRIEPPPPHSPPAGAAARVSSAAVEHADLPPAAPKTLERNEPDVKRLERTPKEAVESKAVEDLTSGFVELPPWNRRDVFIHPYGVAEKMLFEQIELQLTGVRQHAASIGLFTPLSEAGRISDLDNIPLQPIIGWKKQLEAPVRLNQYLFSSTADIRRGAEAANVLKIPMIDLKGKYRVLPFTAVSHAVFDLADAQGVDLWAEASELEGKGVPFVQYLLQHKRLDEHKPPSSQAYCEFRAVEVSSAEEFVVDVLTSQGESIVYKENIFIQQFADYWQRFGRYSEQLERSGGCFSCRHYH